MKRLYPALAFLILFIIANSCTKESTIKLESETLDKKLTKVSSSNSTNNDNYITIISS